MSSPSEGHTFRFLMDIRGSHKVAGDTEYTDEKDFAGIYHTFDVRAWSLVEALRKASEMPFNELMNRTDVLANPKEIEKAIQIGVEIEKDDPNLSDIVSGLTPRQIEWISNWLAGEGFRR